jgi:hypothetical protein
MNSQKLEDLFIRSLDAPLTEQEQKEFRDALATDPSIEKELSEHRKIRESLRRKEPSSFGPYFASKLITIIQDTGIVIDHQLFLFFRKFQLAAIGVVVALLIGNIILSEEKNLPSFLGFEQSTPENEEIVSFDYSQSLIK